MTIPQTFDLALQRHRAGQLADAEALYRQILAVQPNHADALHLLGVIAYQTGRHKAALELIPQAIVLNPNNPFAHSNLGEVYRTIGRFDEAIAAYRRALQLEPDSSPAHNNVGIALRERGRLDEAVASFQRALELKSDYPKAHNNLGNALKDMGRLDEAIQAYRRALHLMRDDPSAHSNLIYVLHFLPGNNAPSIDEERQSWNRQFSDPENRSILPHANDRSPERRLRIGYVSPDFRDHVVGRNLIPLFERHDRRDFEIFCYAGVVQPDKLTEEFRQHAEAWRSTVGMSDEDLAGMIRHDGVDILVDLTQHMAGNRLPMFARKPAPVQVSFAGYPESAGLDAIEYRISDRYLEAGAVAGLSEAGAVAGLPEAGAVAGLSEAGGRSPGGHSRNCGIDAVAAERVHLIDSFWCYDPCGVEVKPNGLPAIKSGTVTFGCLNNFCKVNEPVLNLWARVLGQVTDSRMVLLSRAGSHRQRTLETLEKRGVDSNRVEILDLRPRHEYLRLYHRVDIVLDTFPYNGHTTNLDALWMGVPVVSLAGDTAVSRAGLSQLTNLGLPELAARSEDDYIRIAVELAADLPRLAQLRSTLRDRMKSSVLMDAPRFARQIEHAYREMWQAWCAKQSS